MNPKRDWKATRLVWFIGIWKIPLIWYVRPMVEELNAKRCRLRIPLKRRTKNHLGSLYLGALAVGADLAGGLIALNLIREKGYSTKLVFKDFHADFHKRADGDVLFSCQDGPEISRAIEQVHTSGERETIPISVVATVPELYGNEPVATFRLGLSLK